MVLTGVKTMAGALETELSSNATLVSEWSERNTPAAGQEDNGTILFQLVKVSRSQHKSSFCFFLSNHKSI